MVDHEDLGGDTPVWVTLRVGDAEDLSILGAHYAVQ